MNPTRRDVLRLTGAGALAGVVRALRADVPAATAPANQKRHIVTLSFDDGFRKSSIKTAEIYRKRGLAACINVVATAGRKDFRPPDYPGVVRGDFALWNELRAAGHEIMPHGYRHANKRSLPPAEAKDLIQRCLDIFAAELKGFRAKEAVFNFPYNASTPELEKWLGERVRAFRTGGGGINPLPHKAQVKLTCTSFGPGNCEAAIDREVTKLLARESGWLIFNTHGLDDEGWGPVRAVYLEKLLDRLGGVESVAVLPAGRALAGSE